MDLLINQTTQDLVLSKGQLSYTNNNVDELVQRLWLRLKTYKRDWFWNTQYGIDYINDVFGINKQKLQVDVIIRNAIEEDPLVSEVLNFTSTLSDYKYACEFTVKSRKLQATTKIYYLVNENGVYLTDEYGNRLFTEY